MNHFILLSLLFLPSVVYSSPTDVANGSKTRRDDESTGEGIGPSDGLPFSSSPAIPMFSHLSFPPPGLFGQLPPPHPHHQPGPPALGPIPAASGFTAFYRPLPPPSQPQLAMAMAPRMSPYPPQMPFLPHPTMMPLMGLQPLKRWDESSLFDSLLHSESHLEPFGLLDEPIELEEEDLLAHRRPSPPPASPAHRRESFSNSDHHHHHHHHRSHYRQALHEPAERHRSDPYEPIGMENRFDRPPVESRSYRGGDYGGSGDGDARDHREGGNVAPVDDRADRYGSSSHYDRHGIDHGHPHPRVSSHSHNHGHSHNNPAPAAPVASDFVEKKK